MANWFTVHGPHPIDYELPWDIYLQDRYKAIADDIHINDQIFFYELKGSKYIEINHIKYETHQGKMGLVHVGKVINSPYSRSIEKAQSTTLKGESKNWSVGIPTDAGVSVGFVPREKVVSILGHKNSYYFRGYANGAGIKQIDDAQASELLMFFEGA